MTPFNIFTHWRYHSRKADTNGRVIEDEDRESDKEEIEGEREWLREFRQRIECLSLVESSAHLLQNLGSRSTSQQQSPLMRLPVELRLKIWEEYLGNEDVYVLFTHIDKCIHSFRTNKDPTELPETLKSISDRQPHWRDDLAKRNRLLRQSIGIFPLLLTCKAIHCEFINIIYCKISFTFCDIYSFLAFSISIPRSHLTLITTINFNFTASVTSRIIQNVELRPWNKPFSDCHINHIDQELDYTYIASRRIKYFHALPLPSQNINCVSTWDVACLVLAGMEGLRRFEMAVDRERFDTIGERWEELWRDIGLWDMHDSYWEEPPGLVVVNPFSLEPLQQVRERGLERFEVYINGKRQWDDGESA
ncbi:hypothetical protein CC78DRAFT_536401 [Lojkania enalia]|uniref:DUF7730 domain-containing protein n=1 Tax=Lojkania enalia TaxID=147567 RepID=A0A9P4K1W9_9PLEO|nr:hypothetical protein CC78DRAFT_536401 [Didymosphaeria enalia]